MMGGTSDPPKDAKVLSWAKATSEWSKETLIPCPDGHPQISHDELRPEKADVVIISANADHARKCDSCRRAFTSLLQLPHMWWSDYSRRSNGYFGCEVIASDGGQGETPSSVVSWARLMAKYLESEEKYTWEKLNVIVHWKMVKGQAQTTIVVFDARPRLRGCVDPSLRSSVESVTNSATFRDPFWAYEGLLEGFVGLQDEAVWRLRSLLRNIEKSREISTIATSPGFPRLHELARHAIHVTETIDVAVNVMTNMLSQHESVMKSLVETAAAPRFLTTRSRLLFYHNMFDNLRYRSSANQQRVQSEIQLAFNMVSQRDSSAMRKDSNAMRTIAVLTLIFLPATFIAAIFSTSFFGILDDGTWVMSDNFWMYWAFAIPVTLATSAFWAYLKDGWPLHTGTPEYVRHNSR